MYKKILTVVAVGMVSTSLFAVNSTSSTFPSDHNKAVSNTAATNDPLTKPGTFKQAEGSFPKNSAATSRNTSSNKVGVEKRTISSEYPAEKTPTVPQGEGVYKQPTTLYPDTTANPTTEPQK